QRVGEEVQAGSQAYIVVPRIEADDDDSDTADVLSLFAELTHGPMSDLRVGMLHGRMPTQDKDDIMADFARGALEVLVATTVVEVVVDVPKATLMVIMAADRFGISQLHQLRGRIGRGSKSRLCLLVTGGQPGTAAR